MTHRYSKYLKEINLTGNILFLNIAFFFVYFFVFGHFDNLFRSAYFELCLFFNIAWIISAYVIKLHETSRVASIEGVIRKLFNALGLYLIIIFAFIGLKEGAYYNLFVFYAYCATSFSLALFNIGFVVSLKYYRRVGYNYRKVIIAGYGEISQDLRRYFTHNPDFGYKFLGYFDNKTKSSIIKGKINDIPDYIKEFDIDEIYCILPHLDYSDVEYITKHAEDNFIKIHAIPDYRGFQYKNIEVQLYGLIPVLKVASQPLDDPINRFYKRGFDILFVLIFLVFIGFWLFPLIALLLKLDSNGPILFKQKRSGISNLPFTCYKFRSMQVNMDADVIQATKDDSRITKIGVLLRKTNLDEIPQFFNVLRGDMSIVGPRPHMLKHTEDFSRQVDKYMLRHYVKPGITGLAQTKGFRGATNSFYKLKNRIKLDRFYVENWSLILDLKIIVATVLIMLHGDKNAY